MASASSFFSSMALRYLSAGRIDRPLVAHLRPNPIQPPHSCPRPVIAFYSRRNNTASAITSSKQKKKKLPRNDVAEEEDDDEDALEALFSQLEEDLKNDDPSLDDDNVGEIREEDLAKLESELDEALADDELVGAFDSAKDGEISYMADDDDNDDDKEEEVNLKNWQLRRLAYALKNGRRKTSIKNLADDVCLDRSVVLQLLRDPPPNLLLISAALPDKPFSTISKPESEPQETVSEETTANEAQPEDKVKFPVHVMQSSWSAQKRLKKVQVETLERVYARTKRPTNAMISSIVHVTNLPRKRVVKWFEDKRAEDRVPDHRLPYQRSPRETVFNSQKNLL